MMSDELKNNTDLQSNIVVDEQQKEEEEKLFDIIIPLGPYDVDKINRQLEYNKKNVIGYRNIYIIPYDPDIQLEGCITIPETIFPFNVWSVYNFHGKKIIETRK
jgi:flagellar biosynthesis/type III secretory pathway protein FliH